MTISRLNGVCVEVLIVSFFSTACAGGQSEPDDASSRSEPRATAAAPGDAAEEPEAVEAVPDVVARATLVPLVSSIVPGKSFRMALKFDIAEGYRLSWTNPGDVGKIPEVRFSAPEGFDVGAPQWPAPERFQVTSDLSSYGYEDDAAVFVSIHVPKTIKTNEAYRFGVEAEWVACKRECAKENVNAFVELVAAWNGGEAVDDGILDRLVDRVPRPFDDLKGAEHEWSSRQGREVLVLRAPAVRFVAFYPASREIPFEELSVSRNGEAALEFTETPARRAVRGVVQIERDGEAQFFSLETPASEDT